MNVRRRFAPAVLAVVAAGGLGACASTPSAQRIARDVVDQMVVQGQISAEAGDCMHERISDYTNDELQDIAESAAAGNIDGRADLGEFQRDLAACT